MSSMSRQYSAILLYTFVSVYSRSLWLSCISFPSGIGAVPSIEKTVMKTLLMVSWAETDRRVCSLTGKMNSSAKCGEVMFLLGFELMQVPAYSICTKLRVYVNHDSAGFHNPATLPTSRIKRDGTASFHPDIFSMFKFWATVMFSLWS